MEQPVFHYLRSMTVLAILAIIAGVIGIVGSIIPGLPGPPVSWVGMLLAFLAKGLNSTGERMSLTLLLVWLAITIIVSILDYVIPAKFTKITGGSKAASRGALAGLVLGMFFTPIGMILGRLICAFAAELLFSGKGIALSVKAALGTFLGFITGTWLKLVTSSVMLYYIIVYAF